MALAFDRDGRDEALLLREDADLDDRGGSGEAFLFDAAEVREDANEIRRLRARRELRRRW